MLHFVRFIFFVSRTRTTVLVLFTSRGRANLRIPVALFSCSSRGRALCYRVSFLYVRRAIRASFTSRCDSIISCVAQPSHLIESLLSVKTSHNLLSRRASRTRSHPRAAAVFIGFCFLASHSFASIARQLRSKSCSSVARDSLTQREAQFFAASRRLPSTSLGGGECDGYLLVLAIVLCCRRYTYRIDAKSPIYYFIK